MAELIGAVATVTHKGTRDSWFPWLAAKSDPCYVLSNAQLFITLGHDCFSVPQGRVPIFSAYSRVPRSGVQHLFTAVNFPRAPLTPSLVSTTSSVIFQYTRYSSTMSKVKFSWRMKLMEDSRVTSRVRWLNICCQRFKNNLCSHDIRLEGLRKSMKMMNSRTCLYQGKCR
ncbi:hypothetical protein L798_05081 [Zootermopsis nevadensis]|uniref:Uncharacterized protein n=1 Tax=Zootermopsis nevadensis TaxID=136037 RepID=A0A067RUD3_ZOONE|nr:hypothetical protein L798_05081 [Zootermopsis nevadensis]